MYVITNEIVESIVVEAKNLLEEIQSMILRLVWVRPLDCPWGGKWVAELEFSMGRGLAYQWAGESHGWGGISRRRTVVRERELFPRLTSLVGGGVGLPVG